jgi:glycosyltransferase involved in cell wall biosynthesis
VRVLVAHNGYQQRGGEDAVVQAEAALLQAHGHEVIEYRRHNDELSAVGRVAAAVDTFWSRRTARDIGDSIASQAPDVIHVHNTFPLISPSLYWAAARARVPVVQTLHNFRLICPQAMFLREGRVCEDCLGRQPWRGVVHGCYRDSVPQTAVLTGMLMLHRGLGTWQDKVTRYIALNEFCRRKFIEGGLPADRLVVKPNFVDFEPPPSQPREGVLFVGRLSKEKGVDVLARASQQVPGLRIAVAGTGPEMHVLDRAPQIERLGAISGDAVRVRMQRATALVLPSIWYENFPRTLVEAFASGLPVIASRIGALAELIEDGRTGLLFEPGNADDLARKLRWAQENPARLTDMGQEARALYEAKFSGPPNYRTLMAIYEDAIEATKAPQGR